MLAVVSPAKKLDFDPLPEPLPFSQPALLDDTRILSKVTARLKAKDLQALMGISEKLAELNHDRFQRFTTETEAPGADAKQAALAFAGDTYIGLEASTLSQADLEWAQDHLTLLSGLYGALRPLDLIQPYRLEMGTRLKTRRGENLYRFWGEKVTRRLKVITKDHADRTVTNLASKEYFSVLQPEKLGAPVITMDFKEIKDGKARTLGLFAKRARGMMARYLITTRADSPEQLKAFNGGGYEYQAELSTAERWVFTR